MNKKVILLILIFLCSHKISFAKTIGSFSGKVNFSTQELNVAFAFNKRGKLASKLNVVSDNKIKGLFNLEHIKFLGLNFSSEINSSLSFVKDKDAKGLFIDGSILSKYLLINYKPARDFYGKFSIENSNINIKSLSVGAVECSGNINLTYPYDIDIKININNLALKDLLSFWMGDKIQSYSGDIYGNIRLSGNLGKIFTEVSLDGYNGYAKHLIHIRDLEYDSIHINADGYYPKLFIHDSTVSRTNGIDFTVEGQLDVNNIANLTKQIRDLTLAAVVSDTNSEVEWIFKKLHQGTSTTTEIKYLLRKNSDLMGPENNELDMLGIERRLEF